MIKSLIILAILVIAIPANAQMKVTPIQVGWKYSEAMDSMAKWAAPWKLKINEVYVGSALFEATSESMPYLDMDGIFVLKVNTDSVINSVMFFVYKGGASHFLKVRDLLSVTGKADRLEHDGEFYSQSWSSGNLLTTLLLSESGSVSLEQQLLNDPPPPAPKPAKKGKKQ